MFELREGEAPGVYVLAGRLDAAAAEIVRPDFLTLGGPLTLDGSELEYISSAGIAILIETFKRLQATGQKFKLVRLQPRVRNVFAYAGLDQLLTIE